MGSARLSSQPNLPSFAAPLADEEAILDTFVLALTKGEVTPETWEALHAAAVRDDRVAELAFAYEATAQARRLKAAPAGAQAEFLYRAATLFADVLGDEIGARAYFEKALAADPLHNASFSRADELLLRLGADEPRGDFYVHAATRRSAEDQADLLRRAVRLYDEARCEEKALSALKLLVGAVPLDANARADLEARLVASNRHRDVAQLLERALELPLEPPALLSIRARLVEVLADRLQEPERTMPHLEALLADEPTHALARRVGRQLLEIKALAGRAAALLASSGTPPAERAAYLEVELQHAHGPRRKELLRTLAILRQDELEDEPGALSAIEQALGLDPSDEALRQRFERLGLRLRGPLEVGQGLVRLAAGIKAPAERARITARAGELFVDGGDGRRARSTLASVLGATGADTDAQLIAARALARLCETERDPRGLVDALSRISSLATSADERHAADERIAELCTSTLRDVDRAITAWRRLVESPARTRALEALLPLYERKAQWLDMAYVLEQLASDTSDRERARAFSFRASEVLTTKGKDSARASDAWRAFVETFGPARDAYAHWIPLLEEQRAWTELIEVLEHDADLASGQEKATIYGRLGSLHLQRMRDTRRAIEAYGRALKLDPQDQPSRAALEKLLTSSAEHRLLAAAELEPLYRQLGDTQGLIRTLNARALGSTSADAQLAALAEAADILAPTAKDKALEFLVRGLELVLDTETPIGPWIHRFDQVSESLGPRRRATVLARALSQRVVASPSTLELSMRVGAAHEEAGDPSAALAIYRQALAYDTTSSVLLERVDRLLKAQGNANERVRIFRDALANTTEPSQRRKFLHELGTLERFELSHPEAALDAYRQAFRENPNDRVAHEAVVELLGESASWPALCDHFDDYLSHPRTPEDARDAHVRLTCIAAEHGDAHRGHESARTLLREAQLGELELAVIERIAERLGDDLLLQQVLERRVEVPAEPPLQIERLERLAILAARRDQASEAASRLRQAIEVARSASDDARAFHLLESLRILVPDDADPLAQLIELHERAQQWEEIPSLLTSLLTLQTDRHRRADLLVKLSLLCERKLEDFRGAFEAAKEALSLTPESQHVQAIVARLVRDEGQVAGLVSSVNQILHHAPISSDIDGNALRLGLLLTKAGTLAMFEATKLDAVRSFREVIEQHPTSHATEQARDGLAKLLPELPSGDTKASEVRWFHGWLVTHSEPSRRSRALFAWAETEELQLGDPRAAMALYRQILEADPTEVEALDAITRLSLDLGDIEGALSALAAKRIAASGAAATEIDVDIARVLAERAGRAEEALERISHVLQHAPGDERALEFCLRLLSLPELRSRAATVVERVIDTLEDTEQRLRTYGMLVAAEPRRELCERYLEALVASGRVDQAYDVALSSASKLPFEHALWERAESLARTLSRPDPLAETFELALERLATEEQRRQDGSVPISAALDLGRHAVAFFDEWYEDSRRTARVLRRLLDLDPSDAWSFERLRRVLDSEERWDELFALYDRAADAASLDRKTLLLEDAARIAKDFAGEPTRAIGYFEKLRELIPGTGRFEAPLERLYERLGRTRDLITLRGARIANLDAPHAQRERARIAEAWLDPLRDPGAALLVLEDILEHGRSNPSGASTVDVVPLLERVLEHAERATPTRVELPARDDGRSDVYRPTSSIQGLVRQRAAWLLEGFYAEQGNEAELARVLEIQLEFVELPFERIRRLEHVAGLRAGLGEDEAALGHLEELVLLAPEVALHRDELARVATRIGRVDRLVHVLLTSAERTEYSQLAAELLIEAGELAEDRLGDDTRAIQIFARVVTLEALSDSARRAACRRLERLYERAKRSESRLDVLHQLATLEEEPELRNHTLGEAARLATSLGQLDRAAAYWKLRLETHPADIDALDGLVALLEELAQWSELVDILHRRAALEGRPREACISDRMRAACILADRLGATAAAIDAWRNIDREAGTGGPATDALIALYERAARWKELTELLTGCAERSVSRADKAARLAARGDVELREMLDVHSAITSYEQALALDGSNRRAQTGLREVTEDPAHRDRVIPTLLHAFTETGDFAGVLSLTEARVASTSELTAQRFILRDAARIALEHEHSPRLAFGFVRRALTLDPTDQDSAEELARLSTLSDEPRAFVDAVRELLSEVTASWADDLRFRAGVTLETALGDRSSALEVFESVSRVHPAAVEPALAIFRVAGSLSRWDVVAKTLLETTRANNTLDRKLVESAEHAADAHGGWDALAFALAGVVGQAERLLPSTARDLESLVAAWHRDHRGDPDAAEAAFTRALRHDPSNEHVLHALSQLQRRARGRPLVESLTRLSESKGGDLALLDEAADVALGTIGDRALARPLLEKLLRVASERWLADRSAESECTPFIERGLTELIRIHTDEGEPPRVVSLLEEVATLPWPLDKARALLHQAARVIVDKLDDHERAISLYLDLLGKDPSDETATTELSALYTKLGRRSDLRDLTRILASQAASPTRRLRLRLELSRLEDELGDADVAVAIALENLREASRHEETLTYLVGLLERDRKLDELEALYASEAELAAEASEVSIATEFLWRAAKLAEEDRNDIPRAILHLDRIATLDESADVLDALARLSLAIDAYDSAAEYLARLVERSDERKRVDVSLRLSDALARAERSAEACEHLAGELERTPATPELRARLAELLRKREDWAALAALLTASASYAPDKTTRFAWLCEAAQLRRHRTNEPALAVSLLEDALELFPSDATLRLALADALGASGRVQEARTSLRAMLEAFGPRRPIERASVHHQLARLDLSLGDRARALIELDAASRIDPSSSDILRTMAELARDDGQLERAERAYRAMLPLLSHGTAANEYLGDGSRLTRAEVLYELSRLARLQGEEIRSREILETAFDVASSAPEDARKLEATLKRDGNFEGLARALELRLASESPPRAELHTELAAVYHEHLGRSSDALDLVLQAIALEPAHDASHDLASRIAIPLGALERYESALEKIAKSTAIPLDLAGSTYVRLAHLCDDHRGDDARTADLYEKALELRPTDRDILRALATTYERTSDIAGEARTLNRAILLDEASGRLDPTALYQLAETRLRLGDVVSACDALGRAFELEPDIERAERTVRQATSERKAGTEDTVAELFERIARASRREQTLIDALMFRWSLPEGPIDALKEAVGVAHRIHDTEQAQTLLRRFLESESFARTPAPSRVWAMTELAALCIEAGRAKEAAFLKREAAEIASPEEARRLSFEVADLASGPLADLPLAASIYEDLLERHPKDHDAARALMDTYRRLGDFTKLAALLGRMLENTSDRAERSRLHLERIKLRMDKLKMRDDEAIAALVSVTEEDPRNVDAAILLANLYERDGRHTDALDALEQQLASCKESNDTNAIGVLSQRLGELYEPHDRERARAIYREALSWAPTTDAVLASLERFFSQDGDAQTCADILERRLGLARGDDAARIAIELADQRNLLGAPADALRALELGAEAAPTHAGIRDRLQAIYRTEASYEKLAHLFAREARSQDAPAERATRLREAARILRDDAQAPREAARMLGEAWAAYPREAALFTEFLDTLEHSGDLAGVIEALSGEIDQCDLRDPRRAPLVGRRAVARSQHGDFERALSDFEQAIAAGETARIKDLCQLLERLAAQAAQAGDLASARRHDLSLAAWHTEVGEFDAARRTLSELLDRDGKDVEALRALAFAEEAAQDWTAASATCRKLVGLESPSTVAAAALKLVTVCEAAGRLADARGGLERARLAVPEDRVLRERLAWLYGRIGATAELALLVLEDARTQHDVGPRFEGLLRAGQLLLEAMHLEEASAVDPTLAITTLEEAHTLRPSDLDCAALLSDAYAASSRDADARDTLTRAIATLKGRRARELSTIYHRLARLAEREGNRDAELMHLTAALDMDGQNGEAASDLAMLGMELGHLDVAQRALRQVTTLRTPAPLSKALAYFYLGEIAVRQGDPRRAVMLYRRALDEDRTLLSAKEALEKLQATG
jgi:tetratricopeptide (TPR) repeat protein